MKVQALAFFRDDEKGQLRVPGEQWETNLVWAALLELKGLIKRAPGPSADKRGAGAGADKGQPVRLS